VEITVLEILGNYNLRNTNSRKAVLLFFLRNNYALSQLDIENAIGDLFDRTTIFRTLKTFLKSGLIHKVLDEGGGAKFALTQSATTECEYFNEHIHFKCRHCGLINCIANVGVPQIQLPAGYKVEKSNVLYEGTCNNCNLPATSTKNLRV
jgi:Fur family ferric uptake transcriptional regulator